MSKKPTTTKLSPATEYWLNRILRDHSIQLFVLGLLVLLIVLATVIGGIYVESKESNRQSNSTINVINRSNTTIDGFTTTTNESVIMQNGEIISTSSGKTVKMKNGTIEIIQ